jgi:cytochrome c peroxidase
MRLRKVFSFALHVTLAAAICAPLFADKQANDELRRILGIPRGFPQPVLPADNIPTPAKVQLGRYLFYDRRLSGNGTQSCADCHQQARAFTDGRPRAIGSTGELHFRSSMALPNSAYAVVLTWANPSMHTLEEQALVPLMNENPVEMGVRHREATVLSRIAEVAEYAQLFPAAFPGDPRPVTLPNIAKAIASFERSILSGRSRYDRYVFDADTDALTDTEKRGMRLFFGERAHCGTCHGGITFAGAGAYAEKTPPDPSFENTALYNLDDAGAYPDVDGGLARATANCADMGRFRVPTLRNIAVTAPYMHDGSIATLEEVIDHYAEGGRAGARNPLRSGEMQPFAISAGDKQDLVAFLRALTDEELLVDQRFSNPWTKHATRVPDLSSRSRRPSMPL